MAAVIDGRRRRRRHSDEFKARVVSACRKPGVSIAGVALANGLNANLLRRWLVESEGTAGKAAVRDGVPARPRKAEFVPVRVLDEAVSGADIRIALKGSNVSVEIRWPLAASGQCAAWLRTLLG